MPPINFFKGHPSTKLLPSDRLATAFKEVLVNSDYSQYETEAHNQNPLAYGTDHGNYDVRKSVSDWNNRTFGFKLSIPEHINLTGGALYGIANILNSVTDVTDLTKRIFIVSPTYYLVNHVFVDLGFEGKLAAIEETGGKEYEIDLAHLESDLIKYSEGLPESNENIEINVVNDPIRGDRKIYRFVIYIVPTFSNPGGLTYSTKTRKKLIELARKYDVLIISDDVYDLLNYTNTPIIPRLNYIDLESLPEAKTYGNTISNGTFSKLIAPGLRVGWQESATPRLGNQLALTGANKSGGSPSQLNSLAVANLINTGELDKLIDELKDVYSKRATVLLAALNEHLPANTIHHGGEGGYFIWVKFNTDLEGFDHSKVVTALQEKHQVLLADGNFFDVVGDERNWGKDSARLSLSFLDEGEIKEGIKLWGQVLKELYPALYK